MIFYHLILLFSITINRLKANECVPSETTASGAHFSSSSEKLCSGELIFNEDFDTFDLSKWQHEVTLTGGGNYEFQYYLNNRTNSFVKDGLLHIRPTYLSDDYGEDFLYSGTLDLGAECTNADNNGCRRTGSATNILNPIKSARIRTIDSFSFTYGTAEFRAKVPQGDWLWPAIWFLPTDWAYGSWPTSGEIDLLESRGNRELKNPSGVNIGDEQVASTLHWGPSPAENQFQRTHFERDNAATYHSDFHVYKVEWTSTGFKFFVDGECIGTITPPAGGFYEMGQFNGRNPWESGSRMAPFDRKFHILINLAIGGTTGFFPEGMVNPGGKPWNNDSPTAMTDFWKGKSQWESTWNLATEDDQLIVDYVKIYAA